MAALSHKHKLKNTNNKFIYSVYYIFKALKLFHVSWESAVGRATHYGLDGLGTESRWGRDFVHLSRLALGPARPPIQCVPGLSRG